MEKKYLTKTYGKGDEVDINHLYKVVANIDRNAAEHKWEWVETWDGLGEMYLMIDTDKPRGEQVVCQYSLIPTPISYFGRVMSGGKTENCMSHPDLRGKKLFFPFEKENFEKVKSRFDFFFTTTGLGAPGAIRRKLGYKAIDYWTEYHFFWESQDGYNYYWKDLNIILKKGPKFVRSVVSTLFNIWNNVQCNRKRKGLNNRVNHSYTILGFKKDKTLHDIEKLWEKNRVSYGISVERSKEYLSWRIGQNPYFEHKYICLYEQNEMIGYVIYHDFDNNTSKIIDIIVDDKDLNIAKSLISELQQAAFKENRSGLICSTLRENLFLKQIFSQNGFGVKDFSKIKKKFSKDKREDRPFHGYIKPTIDSSDKLEIASNWYVTEIIKEGRTFPSN